MSEFERIKYPDGQISAKWKGSVMRGGIIPEGFIRERINSYEDLFYVRAIADVLKNYRVPFRRFFIPCMFGQRSDRRFERFQSFDLKLICDVINECDFNEVEILDPHSDVTLALINNSKKLSSFEQVEKVIGDIADRQFIKDGLETGLLLVSPDAGAYKKVFEFGEKLKLPVMAAVKHRDKSGKVDLTFTHDVEDKVCLIVDDLCDGGYTFTTLAKALKQNHAKRVYLYITHGLFSKGFKELVENIEHIYTTNSIKDLDLDEIAIDKYDKPFKVGDFVTQYKVL